MLIPRIFKKATEAALNVSICATHDDYFVEHLKEQFNIPFILRTIPIGVKYTNRWLLDIAQFFGIEKEAQRFIDLEIELFLGYTGVFEFARRVARILRNPSFNRKLGANVRLPYFDNWYEKDAFAYIDEGDIQLDAKVT